MITTATLNLVRADFADVSAIAAKEVSKWAFDYLNSIDSQKQQIIYTKPVSTFPIASIVEEGSPNPTVTQLALPQLTMTQKRRGLKYIHTVEAETFDPYNMVSLRAKEIGKALEERKELDAQNMLLNNAFDSAYPISTTKALFADDHPVGDITHDNLESASALSWAVLESMAVALGRQRDPRNRVMAMRDKLYLLVNPSLEFTADTLTQSAMRPGTSDNDKNVLMSRFTPVVLDHATSTTAFALVPVDKSKHGLKKVVEVDAKNGHDGDEDGNHKFSRWAFYALGADHPFNIRGNAGA